MLVPLRNRKFHCREYKSLAEGSIRLQSSTSLYYLCPNLTLSFHLQLDLPYLNDFLINILTNLMSSHAYYMPHQSYRFLSLQHYLAKSIRRTILYFLSVIFLRLLFKYVPQALPVVVPIPAEVITLHTF